MITDNEHVESLRSDTLAIPQTKPTPRPRLHNKKLGNLMYMTRAVKAMTQQQLAESVGVARQTISDVECGREQPSVGLAIAIATTLDAKVEDLFKLR